MARKGADFQTLRSEGGLLPADLLRRVIDPKEKLAGTQPHDYGLPPGDRLNEAITQSWSRLLRHWAEFRTAAAKLPPGEPGTGLTNEKWSLPLLRELGFGMLPTTAGPELGGRLYAINRFFGPVPIHLVGCGVSLDRRAAGVRGAASVNPHGLVQEFLNRSPGHLWAIVSNGLTLRVLRDNQALSRQSYLEFDIEAMLTGEVYSDFVLLWLMVHASRLAPRQDGRPETCWLEEWTSLAEEQGTRALGDLRISVQKALQILGEGFTSHPRNTALRDGLRGGSIPLNDFHGQLLRVVYRLIFLFVAEDRTLDGASVLHPPLPTASVAEGGLQYQTPAPDLAQVAEPRAVYRPGSSGAAVQARARYAAHYSTARLREQASRIKGSRHGDAWRQFQIIVGALSGDGAHATTREALALPSLGSFLWDPASTADLNEAELSNFVFLDSVRHLAFTRAGKVLRPVDYRSLGAEELGGVYEGLLALTPQLSSDGAHFTFAEFAGNERKTSGSFYTHDALVQCLLDSALDPIVADAVRGKTGTQAEEAILSLKVCDPAVGSGHFLVGAAHRLARHLARARAASQGESEPSPQLYQHALRDVIGRCLYGVDINPMAAELCRVSLWLEALEPGKPLSFLDHHVRIGNSLIGATPELMAGGLPDEAFAAVEGDDKKACTALRSRNKGERAGLGSLFSTEDAETQARLQQAAAALDQLPDDRPEDIKAKERAFRHHEGTDEYRHKRRLADAWCAAFLIRKYFSEPGRESSAVGLTQRHLDALAAGRPLPPDLQLTLEELARDYQFFHWHLAFPEVFARGGFDCILGNPPWDTLSPDQREFFGSWVVGLRSMAPEEQQAAIEALLAQPEIDCAWTRHCRDLFALVHFLKNSGTYTLYAPGNLGKGDFNIYRMFVECALRRVRERGRAALVVPGGLYGGANASAIRKHLLDACELVELLGLINTTRKWFREVDIDRFAAFVASRGGRTSTFRARFGLASPEDLGTTPVEMDANVIRQTAPDTYAIPDVRDLSQLSISRKMHAACPAFGTTTLGPPIRHYSAELHMGSNRDLFTTDAAGLPVYEGRMIDHFDHRAKTYDSGHGNSAVWIEREFGDPAKAIVPQWRVLREHLPSKLGDRCDRYRIGFGDVANPRNERSFTATLIPPGVVCGHTVPTFVFPQGFEWCYLTWLAVANSFTMDSLVRRKLSSPHMTYTVLDGLPFPRPSLEDAWVRTVAPVVLRLVCTSPEMTPYWNAMVTHGLVPPTLEGATPVTALTAPEERALARARLDAIVARHIFGLTRDELASLLGTFPVLQRRELRTFGEFQTKRLVLDAFDGAA